MSEAFSSRRPVQLDNIIVYTGPPAAENRKIRPLRPAPTPRERDDSLPPVAMRTVAGWVENGSRTDTPNYDCNKLTSTVPTSVTGEPASRKEQFDTSTRTETDDYYPVAGMSFCTAMWPDLWGDVDISTDAASARNEMPDLPSCSTVDILSLCASTMSSAADLAGLQQRPLDNVEFTRAGSSPGPELPSISLSPEVLRSRACSADTAAPADGSIGRDRSSGLAQEAPVVVHPTMRELPDVSQSVCIETGAQSRSSRTQIKEHDQDAVMTDDATLAFAGDKSCSLLGEEGLILHEPVRAGGSTCEQNGTCDSSDDDIVPWIPKRRRALLIGRSSAERRDASQPSMKRRRRQTHTAEPAVASAPCRTATRPTGRYVPAARSRPRKTIALTAKSTQDEWPVPPRALEFESEPTWEVDRIVRSTRKHGKDYYQVLWKPTWEPAESLQGSADTAVAEFRLSNRGRRMKSGAKVETSSFCICT